MKAGTVEETRATQNKKCARVLVLAGSLAEGERLVRESRGPGMRMEATVATNQKEFLQAVEERKLDAIVADSCVLDWSGLEALREVRARGNNVPFLLVAKAPGSELGMECIKEGASDCIDKEHLSRLPLALHRAVEEQELREETERAHRALAESEASARKRYAELEVIYRCAPHGLEVFDCDLHFVRVNDALAKFSNLKPEAFVGHSIEEMVPEFGREVAECVRGVLETGESVLNVERHRAAPGNPEIQQCFLSSYYPLRGENGNVFGVCGVVMDISERKRAEEAMRLSEARYRAQMEHAPEAIVILDVDQNRFIDANQKAEQLLGHSREGLLQINPVSLSPEYQPDGRLSFEAARSYICAAVDGETPVFEWVHCNGAGEEFPCEVRLVRLPSPKGRLVRGSITDVRERKRAKEALQASETRNRDLVENSVYGIFRATADGRFLDANPALVAMLGCNRAEELQPLTLGDDVYRFPEQFAQHLGECRTRGLVHGAETEWKRRDGGIVTVRVHLRHVSIQGAPETIEFIAEDVTELRAMERQLRQAQKFEAIGQLAGGIAHDFNNVVGAILGWAELGYEQNQGNPREAERFARIREQAERAAALTRELLAFARRQVMQPRAIDLNTVTSGVTSFLDKVIGKDIELKVLTAPLDAVRADPTQLEQVLMNLCLNARDAMPGGGRLMVETEMVELDDSYCRFYPGVTPGRYAVLSVSDTGVGMDNETRERIFEPFFTTKERGKGTGMGLATVYGIVKQHGGFIHVYSEPGQGSLFRVYLPASEGTPAAQTSAVAKVPALAEMKGTETILLADDHDAIREMARQTLVNLGYRVLSAGDGKEALRLCESEAPAIAILDVVMPKMGGPAAAEKLLEKYGPLPILFTSGYSQDSEGMTSAAAHAQYLQKPYSPTALGCMVREILDRKKSQAVVT
ncbi:MAG TPA: PAS domain S-box protein [Methylomirabilota bacterium]|nr:PAS domain S-box protein [Methylomirabilota bacterium]